MRILFISFILMSTQVLAKDKVLGKKYFSHFLGHVHKTTSKDSSSLTIVQCSHSVKLLAEKNPKKGWSYVQVGDDKGYIQSYFLQEKRPECFQGKYPHFYNSYNLTITEMYFWGKLYDHYIQGESKIK